MERETMIDEKELRDKLQELEILKNQLETNLRTNEELEVGISDRERVGETLKALEDLKDDRPLLMPIGGGTYITVKMADKEKAFTALGSDMWLRTDLDKVRNRTEKDLEMMRDGQKELLEKSRKIEGKVRDLSVQIQSEYMRLQKEEAEKGK